jgi:hypothetical protein
VTAGALHLVADLVGLPGTALAELAIAINSPELLELALALKWPGLRLHVVAMNLD